jgi:hypothetical protein
MEIAELLDLHANVIHYRYIKKRRPPQFDTLIAFIRKHFAGRYEVSVQDWSIEPYRMFGRIRHVTGKRRTGKKLVIWPADQSKPQFPLFSHITCETYRTNWDIVAWIVEQHQQNSNEIV